MQNVVNRDSLSAWRALSNIGGLELGDRDEDLATQLKNQIDPSASTLDDALATTSTDLFLQALFRVIQPFALMFRDVLVFFEEAGAREGQAQWKISIGDEYVDAGTTSNASLKYPRSIGRAPLFPIPCDRQLEAMTISWRVSRKTDQDPPGWRM